MRWLVERLRPLAVNPGGTGHWVGFWIVAVCGLAFGSQPRHRALLAAIVVSVFLFAALGLFPFYERFVLWGIPGLYLAMILLVDNALLVGWARSRHVDGARSCSGRRLLLPAGFAPTSSRSDGTTPAIERATTSTGSTIARPSSG